MPPRARSNNNRQYNLFDQEVSLRLPPRFAIDGKILDNPVRQLAAPEQHTKCQLHPFSIRRTTGYEATLHSGERLKIISAKTTTEINADLVLLVPGATTPTQITNALEQGEGRWINANSINIQTLDVTARIQRLATVTNSWRDAVRLREACEPENNQPANPGLRRPQIGALYAALAHTTRSTNPATIVMPTGTGKTETMLALNALQGFEL